MSLHVLESCYNVVAKLTNGLSDRETNDALSAHVSICILERCYNVVAKLTSGLSDRETNDVLSAHVCIDLELGFIMIVHQFEQTQL